MTKNPSVSTNAPAFETISSDDLSSASGGVSSGGWDGNTGWAGGWRGNSGQHGGWQPQYYTVKDGDHQTNIARHTGYSLRDLLHTSPRYRKNPL